MIRPLGFDWKIGVASDRKLCGARGAGVDAEYYLQRREGRERTVARRLFLPFATQRRTDGTPGWTPLTALTLMVFFVLAMQCMSTVAVVRRETNSWAWTLVYDRVYDRPRICRGVHNISGRKIARVGNMMNFQGIIVIALCHRGRVLSSAFMLYKKTRSYVEKARRPVLTTAAVPSTTKPRIAA